jgi:hypothetical protein
MVGKFVAAYVIDGRTYKVYGCRNETQPDGEYESWDVCADGVSLTGCTDRIDPLYSEPTRRDILALLATEEG